MGLDLDRLDKAFFGRAIELWTEWNARINVVSRKDIDNLYEHHVLHSLAIAEYLLRTGGATGSPGRPLSFLDVGCGGGFPGIPLAMAMPDATFTLCDSIGKKVRVAQEVATALGLGNVTCVNARAESLPGSFDYVVSRAVTSLDNFYPWVRGKYKKGILCLKGGDVNQEISDLVRKCKVSPAKVSVWPVSDWLSDEYYSGKYVLCLEDRDRAELLQGGHVHLL